MASQLAIKEKELARLINRIYECDTERDRLQEEVERLEKMMVDSVQVMTTGQRLVSNRE